MTKRKHVDPRELGKVLQGQSAKWLLRLWVLGGRNGRLLIVWETRIPRLEVRDDIAER